ncbi:Crp/Fnr family transcriptional regulator [Lagierella massiliensis]|uniref:Crp/Fnr family transcriptional regulator n=1 Tax=Lagierella massiliensis TaxID=1689303 RepID=UPI0006D7C889|nr:Crp/Fnr family transcriptional regulator [Lagierella massiliensis]
MDNIVNFDSIFIFRYLEDEVINKVYSLDMDHVNFESGDLVVSRGDELNSLLVIKSGLLKQAKYLSDGSEKVVAYYYENEVYPLHLFYEGIKHWPYNIYAESESDIYFIPWNDLKEIISSSETLTNNVLRFTASCTCHTKIILNATRYKKIQQRLAYWLLMKKYVDTCKIPMTQKMLSDTLRVTRPSLNQELKKLESLKVVRIDVNEIEVLDESYLEDILNDV